MEGWVKLNTNGFCKRGSDSACGGILQNSN